MLSVAPDGGNREGRRVVERLEAAERAVVALERARRTAEQLDPDPRERARAVQARLELDARPARLADHVDGTYAGDAELEQPARADRGRTLAAQAHAAAREVLGALVGARPK
jgi:hypothetical protein